MTLPAHASMLTGRTPLSHGVRNNGTFRLREDVPTLATVLKAPAIATGAFVGAFVLDARYGLSRGFDTYDDRYASSAGGPTFGFAERRAAEVVQTAGDWILSAKAGGPWFAWVHLFDPHAPYDAPADYRAGRAPYDAEVAYTDAMLGRLLDRLRAAGALDRTLIVVTADHGESLGDHGETTHGLFAYDSHAGRAAHPQRSRYRARASSMAPRATPTSCRRSATCSAVAPPPDLDGLSLVAAAGAGPAGVLRGPRCQPHPRLGAAHRSRDRGDGSSSTCREPELYDLAADPAESHNLADPGPVTEL